VVKLLSLDGVRSEGGWHGKLVGGGLVSGIVSAPDCDSVCVGGSAPSWLLVGAGRAGVTGEIVVCRSNGWTGRVRLSVVGRFPPFGSFAGCSFAWTGHRWGVLMKFVVAERIYYRVPGVELWDVWGGVVVGSFE